MSAVPRVGSVSSEHFPSGLRSAGPLELIQGSLSARKVARQSPLLASLHRAADGSLLGALVAVALMSTLTLHLQYRWTNSFRRIEVTRNLVLRLTESTALLESDLLERIKSPYSMVRTKASNLVFLEHPSTIKRKNNTRVLPTIGGLFENHIRYGY